MEIRQIGIVSPGEMGGAIAARLVAAGFAGHAALDGRSQRTRQAASAAGLNDVGSIEALVDLVDLVISVVSPAEAPGVATRVAAALVAGRPADGRPAGRRSTPLVFADLNAIAPGSVRREATAIVGAGGIFIDGGIIGPPPRAEGSRTRIYASGPEAGLLEQISQPNLAVRVLSPRVGDASALKMCYAALTKGVTAITVELLVAARRLGVEEAVERELREARSDVLDWQLGSLPVMPPRAGRWVPEMTEVARTFAEVGVAPDLFEGVAGLFSDVAQTPLAEETPQQARASGRDGLEVIRALAEMLGGGRG